MNSRLVNCALLGATALASVAFAAPASAQRVDNIVAFGDSVADDGNLFQLLPSIPPQAAQTYPTGRFTGGTNYIDTLSQLLGVPVDNYAVGGALTNNTNTNGPGLPGFTTEWNLFLTGNSLGGIFPASDGTFDEGDLVTVSIGGNDARIYQSGSTSLGIAPGSLAGAPAAAAASVAAAEVGLDALVDAGAPTISFLALNAALLPEVALSPAAQAVRDAYSTAFNAGIQDVLAGYAANGVIVHYLDLETLFERVAADPGAFGFTSVGPCPLAQATQCVTNYDFANQYLFYVDGVHPTSRASQVIAQYVATQLQGPLVLQAPSDMALDTARQFGRTLSSRVDLSAPRDGDLAEGLKFFVVGDTYSRDIEMTDTTDPFDVDTVGVTGGVSYGFGNGTAGVAVNYSRPKARFVGDRFDDKGESWQVGGFAGFGMLGGFVQGYAGYGTDDHEIERGGVIDNMSADTDGSHWLAGLKAGYLFPVGIVRFGPVASLDYARAKVDGYTESGDAALTVNVDSVTAKTMTGGIGAELRGDFEGGGVQLRPYISAMVESELSGSDRTIRFAQTTAPGIVNQWSLEERSKDPYGRVSFGGSAAILPGATLDVVGSTSLGRDQGDEVSAHVGLRLGF